ncbi:MAG: nucleotidyltransferase family protein [Acidimicrobiales bacterium]
MSDELRSARLLRAAIGLDGPVEPEAADWSAWVALSVTERVLPQLVRAATTSPGLTDAQREEAGRIALDVAGTVVQLEHDLLRVADVLDEADIPFAVLKGTATAHLDHPDPADRQFGDVDLLVDPADLARTGDALKAAGWRQAYRLPRDHDQFTHAVTFMGAGPTELDVHQRIAHRALGRLVPTAELLAARTGFELAGRPLHALSDADRLIHATLHAVTSRGAYQRLSSSVDVLVLAARLVSVAEDAIARSDGWRVGSIVEAGLRDAHRAAQVELPDAWAGALTRPRPQRDRLVDRAYLSPRRRPLLEEAAHLRHLPNWSSRARYAGGYFVIDRTTASAGGRVGFRERARYLWSRVRQRSG